MSFTQSQLTGDEQWEWKEFFTEMVNFQHEVAMKSPGGPAQVTAQNISTYFLALFVELAETLNELDWKPWKLNHKVDKAKVLKEWGDINAFYLIVADLICRRLDMTPAELMQSYFDVSDENVRRFESKY